MKIKIMCIFIIGLFLFTSFSTISAIEIEKTNINDDYDLIAYIELAFVPDIKPLRIMSFDFEKVPTSWTHKEPLKVKFYGKACRVGESDQWISMDADLLFKLESNQGHQTSKNYEIHTDMDGGWKSGDFLITDEWKLKNRLFFDASAIYEIDCSGWAWTPGPNTGEDIPAQYYFDANSYISTRIDLSKDKSISFNKFQRLFDSFPNAFPFLHRLLNI